MKFQVGDVIKTDRWPMEIYIILDINTGIRSFEYRLYSMLDRLTCYGQLELIHDYYKIDSIDNNYLIKLLI